MNLVEEAKIVAVKVHEYVNHTYGKYPYSYHLQMVVDEAMEFKHLVPEDDLDIVLASCWCHDMIEDTRWSYAAVKSVFGKPVAENCVCTNK